MDKSWLDIKDRGNVAYIRGVESFIEWAFIQKGVTSKIRCPCKKCMNVTFKLRTDVKVDLLSKGFWTSYKVWDLHGETSRFRSDCETSSKVVENDTFKEEDLTRMEYDAYGIPSLDDANIRSEGEEPNVNAQKIFDMLKDAETELYPGCGKESKLSFIVKLFQVKCLSHWSNKSMDLLFTVLKEAFPQALIPQSFCEAKKVIRDLGLNYEKIDACEDDCILYWREHANAKSCPKCKAHRELTMHDSTQHKDQPDNSPPTENSSAGSSHTIIKRRGVYKSINMDSRTRFSKIRVQLSDKVPRAMGPGARDLANYCGLTIRTTISLRQCVKWEKAFKKYGEDMLLKVKDKFEPTDAGQEEKFEKYLEIALQKAFSNWKTNLHKHYKEYESDEERLANPPDQLSPEDWEYLLTYFKSPEFQKENRAKQVTKHTCGCLSSAEVDQSVIKHTTKTLDGQFQWSDPIAEEAYIQARDLRQEHELQGDARMTDDKILTSVCGQRFRYVRRKGYGAEPSRKRDRSQSTQSSIDQVRIQLQQYYDKKIQEEREKYEANLAIEHAQMEAKRAKLEEERAQFEKRMDQKMQAQFAILMEKMQTNPNTSVP